MKCSICNTDIIGRYLIDAWGQTICADHKKEHCSSCGRFVRPADTHLTDGRCLCAYCLPSVVRLPEHIAWVETRVRSILASHGISDIPKDIPIRLVSPTEMSKLSGSRHINLSQPGLTRTLKTMGLFFKHFSHRIYLFDYLPKIQFAGVLAHEMLHVWQNERSISLSSKYTEGFCNVGSYVVYSSINTELSRCLIKQLEEDPDPVYGDGFREVVNVFKLKKNLCNTIENICNYGF